MRTIRDNEDGFTGLEAAIVLIAFVVVAAVFSYVVLGAGFFTTQKSQEVVHTGVSQTSSSVEVVGNVYGYTSASQTITYIRFDLGLTAGGSPVDMSKTVMTYSKSGSTEPTYLDWKGGVGTPLSAEGWVVSSVNDGTGTGELLERGEIFTIIVQVPTNEGLEANDQVQLEIKPPAGSVLGLKRTAPPQLDKVNVLY